MTLACYLYYNINIWVVIIIILFVNGVEYSNLGALCIFLHLHHLDILFTMLQYSPVRILTQEFVNHSLSSFNSPKCLNVRITP